MSTVDIKNAIETYVTNKLVPLIGQGSDPNFYVQTFDDHLRDISDPDDFPFLVINAPKKSNRRGEIGTTKELEDWELNIYYLDVAQTERDEDYDVGRDRCNFICNNIEYNLETDPQLGNLRVPILNGLSTAYVYDLVFDEVVFNSAGQPLGWSFTCEMYITVYVAKN